MGEKMAGWSISLLADVYRPESQAARTVQVILVNKTKSTLNWDDSGLEHGKRAQTAPDTISPEHNGSWMLESQGFATGCEGWMRWKIGNDGPMVKLDYDIPFAGSNEYSGRVDPESSIYEVERSGGGGNHARVIFTVKEKEPATNDSDSDSD